MISSVASRALVSINTIKGRRCRAAWAEPRKSQVVDESSANEVRGSMSALRVPNSTLGWAVEVANLGSGVSADDVQVHLRAEYELPEARSVRIVGDGSRATFYYDNPSIGMSSNFSILHPLVYVNINSTRDSSTARRNSFSPYI